AGLFLSNLVILAFSAWAGEDFLNWGWRIPFLLSILLVGVGLWVRLGILETPVFQKLVAERRIERAPIAEVIRRQPREIILSAVLVASLVSFITIPLSGHISDRIGRRKVYLIGAAVTGLFGFLYFGMLDSAAPLAVFI